MKFTIDPNQAQAVVKAEAERQGGSIIREVTPAVRREIVRLFQPPKTGRRYRFGRGAFHQASAPGEPPAIRTGNLLRSIQESYPSPLEGVITIHAPYAMFLEEGTRRMAARPFARVAARNVTIEFTRSRI